ncbi:FAD/NAD(P)-binding protein [Aestuariivirga sp.]|uniref:FAD/NAD(P)-binding protein n=1 Tax=Aestuariivirga sp. TaxID=2650926 RepID=UPI0039E70C56
MSTRPFIIIGGGASGVLLAYQLLKADTVARPVVIIESSRQLGFGLAYGTSSASHLLNVRNSNMSADPEQPNHFLNWLASLPGSAPRPDGFTTRRLYGQYIAGLIGNDLDGGRLSVIHDRAVALSLTQDGVEVKLEQNGRMAGEAIILATGHDSTRHPSFENPWEQHLSQPVAADDRILIAGTGLSMVDYVLELLDRGHMGPITAVSRRGLLSNSHGPTQAWPLDLSGLGKTPSVNAVLRFLRREITRAEAEGVSWRSVIDGMRPHTQTLWKSFSLVERKRFLRHARPWWDVVRHRMAPEASNRIQAAIDAGQLRIVAGNILAFEADGGQRHVFIRERGHNAQRSEAFDHIIDCTGLVSDPELSQDPLVKSLLQQGLGRRDAIGLGLEFNDECALISADGVPHPSIFGVGPITKAGLWEIIAVPDIRVQALYLARRLAERFAAP